MTNQFPVSEDISRAWTEIAQGARLSHRAFSSVGDPAPGSNFTLINAIYPWEKASDWSRSYIDAAYEHLIHWADFVAPFRFHPEQRVRQTLRPAYTLSRAALEASAQALWMLEGGSAKECARRHLSLVRWDFHEHHASKTTPEDKKTVKDREATLVEQSSGDFTEVETRKPDGGYLGIIHKAAKLIERRPADLDRIWRAASGAAHGKNWPSTDLQIVVPGEEYEPGQFRAIRIPDADGMTEVLTAAYDMTSRASLRYADHAGADIQANINEARRWLADQITLKEDADPEALRRLRGDAE
ncbi:hypothetical protein [Aeromicrobium wangtongii]|uniref:hypothetical protein n=1 Tax=Aeromicrobium wangtongii TaxID=2969247 RepID=UPI002017E63E|nr:hypothetical protein [Aeromicrobium wangtongii]MCL3818552.1 hypothetical protein [Aeromicrobium wangtongii]